MGLLDRAHLVALDTETTGLDAFGGDALIEVARVEIEDGAIGATWSTLVRPGRPIPAGASQVHGITEDMLVDAPGPREVAAALGEALAGRVLIFHHAAFDLPFLAALMRAAGSAPLLNPVVDTLGLARGMIEAPGHSLEALAAALGLPGEPRHRALGDALTTARLFLALAPRWERERGIRSLAELAAASQDVLRLAHASGGRVLESGFLAIRPPGDRSRTSEGAAMNAAAPAIGSLAPDFRLRGPGGQFVTLSEFRGHRNVVLVFFPLAFSPACSNQLPEIQRQLERFETLDASVMGVSVDSYFANEAFARRLGVTFPLLSDFHREASRDYGVLLTDKGYSSRTTFVIDKQGRLAHREEPSGPSGFPSNDHVLEALGRLA